MELEAKLAELQQELTVLQMQDKKTLIAQDDPYGVSDHTASGTPTHIEDCSSVGEG